jgi:hypothetical protein
MYSDVVKTCQSMFNLPKIESWKQQWLLVTEKITLTNATFVLIGHAISYHKE